MAVEDGTGYREDGGSEAGESDGSSAEAAAAALASTSVADVGWLEPTALSLPASLPPTPDFLRGR